MEWVILGLFTTVMLPWYSKLVSKKVTEGRLQAESAHFGAFPPQPLQESDNGT